MTDPPATEPPATEPPSRSRPPPIRPPRTARSGPLDDVAPVVEFPEQPADVPFRPRSGPRATCPRRRRRGADSADGRRPEDRHPRPGPREVDRRGAGRPDRHEAYHPARTSTPCTTRSRWRRASRRRASASSSATASSRSTALRPWRRGAIPPIPGTPSRWRTSSTWRAVCSARGLRSDTEPLVMLSSPDASDYVASLPLQDPIGERFNYSTGTTAVLAQILTDAAWALEEDRPVDPTAEPDAEAGIRFLEERLFDPIGITSEELMTDPEGTFLGGVGANMTTRDFAGSACCTCAAASGTASRSSRRTGSSTASRRARRATVRGAVVADAGRGRLHGTGPVRTDRRRRAELDLVVAINSVQGGDSDGLGRGRHRPVPRRGLSSVRPGGRPLRRAPRRRRCGCA